MKYGLLFATLAALLAAMAVWHGGWCWLCSWPAVSCAGVAWGYLKAGPRVYGKSARGVLSSGRQLLLLPFLLYLWSTWYVLRVVKRERAVDQLTDRVYIGRRLLSHELPAQIEHVVDLTCEFTEPAALRAKSYHLYPILDGQAPGPDQLRAWACAVAALPGNVYIHCAEGHGRTGLFAAALLLATGHCRTSDDALEFVRSKRPRVRLGRLQREVLRSLEAAAGPGTSSE